MRTLQQTNYIYKAFNNLTCERSDFQNSHYIRI